MRRTNTRPGYLSEAENTSLMKSNEEPGVNNSEHTQLYIVIYTNHRGKTTQK